MGGTGRGVRQRDGATEEMGEERHERMGAHGPSCGMSYSSWRGDHRMCWEDSRLGCSLLQGKEGKGSGRPPRPGAPPHSLERWQLLPLAGGVGRRVPVTTSPRLELELSPDLLCGQRGKWSCEQRGGCEGGGILFSHMLPCPQDSPAPLVMPQADLCPQGNRSTPEA